jgi:hypothetical protein
MRSDQPVRGEFRGHSSAAACCLAAAWLPRRRPQAGSGPPHAPPGRARAPQPGAHRRPPPAPRATAAPAAGSRRQAARAAAHVRALAARAEADRRHLGTAGEAGLVRAQGEGRGGAPALLAPPSPAVVAATCRCSPAGACLRATRCTLHAAQALRLLGLYMGAMTLGVGAFFVVSYYIHDLAVNYGR